MPKCPECEHDITGPLEPDEMFACPCCGTEIVVTKFRELEVLALEGEDWGE